MNLRRPLVALALVILPIAIVAGTADAHVINESRVYLDVTDRAIGGRIEMPRLDVLQVFGVNVSAVGQGDEALADLAPDLREYAAAHLAVGSAGEWWPVTFTDVELPDPTSGTAENAVVVRFEVNRAFDTVPRTLTVRFDPFFDEVDDATALLLVANDIQAGVVDNIDDVLVRFSADDRTHDVPLDGTSIAKQIRASVGLGIDHIRTGPDHILFVLVLLLPAVMRFTDRGWTPAGSFGSCLWRVMQTATMFTIAHTITFSLAGLGFLPLPPSKLVESVIALSIAIAALHNVRPLLHNREWAIAFVFGLFHGMGFASLVGQLDTSRSTQLVSLLGRNIGIELGQAVVILLVFPMLFALRSTTIYRPLFLAASTVCAGIALGWTVERLFELELGVSDAVEPLTHVRNNLLPIAVLTLAAVAWNRIDATRRRGADV